MITLWKQHGWKRERVYTERHGWTWQYSKGGVIIRRSAGRSMWLLSSVDYSMPFTSVKSAIHYWENK